MIKLIFLLLLFFLSLLVVFRAPTNLLWYVAILVTEFSWVFIVFVLLIFWLPLLPGRYPAAERTIGLVTILLLLLPYWQAWRLAPRLKASFSNVFGPENSIKGAPFRPLQIITGIGARKVAYKEFIYDTTDGLALHFYPAGNSGRRPCVVVIHGGSWAGGNNLQLADLNSELAKSGYHVVSILYRLAPRHRYPAPVEDVEGVVKFLKTNADRLSIDSSQLALLGRSAGAQVALSAAYTLHEPAIKGVIDFYGPADMVWGYENPTSPLVLDSRKIMEDYLGGTLQQAPEQFNRSSATETVTAQAPPTLMIYAGNDPLVSPYHGRFLSEKLSGAGIPHFALYLPWATHGFDYTLNGPGGQLSTWAVKSFLKAVLRHKIGQ
jgi:acetyl esterase/lipase